MLYSPNTPHIISPTPAVTPFTTILLLSIKLFNTFHMDTHTTIPIIRFTS